MIRGISTSNENYLLYSSPIIGGSEGRFYLVQVYSPQVSLTGGFLQAAHIVVTFLVNTDKRFLSRHKLSRQ